MLILDYYIFLSWYFDEWGHLTMVWYQLPTTNYQLHDFSQVPHIC